MSLFLGSCSSPDSPKMIPKPVVQKASAEERSESLIGKVDILFVIDDSGSMGTYQKNIADNIDLFVDKFFGSAVIDYHIGVISTDADTVYSSTKRVCCGQLHGTPAFIDKNTPDAKANLAARLKLGTDGSATERSFDPVKLALSEPVANNENAGFLRKDAFLAIIFITDAQDQSDIDGNELFSHLLSIKGSPQKILAYGALIPSWVDETSECSRDTGKPDRIEEFLTLTANKEDNVFNLCEPDFGEKLAVVAKSIASRVASVIYLKNAPIVETIKVTYGTQIIPKDPSTGWTYDANENAIRLGKNLVLDQMQMDGTRLRADFESTTYDERLQQKQ